MSEGASWHAPNGTRRKLFSAILRSFPLFFAVFAGNSRVCFSQFFAVFLQFFRCFLLFPTRAIKDVPLSALLKWGRPRRGLGGRFGYFLFFPFGGGEGGVRGVRGGGAWFLLKIPRGGGGLAEEGAGGRGARRMFAGNLGGRGAKYFFSGPKFPSRGSNRS